MTLSDLYVSSSGIFRAVVEQLT